MIYQKYHTVRTVPKIYQKYHTVRTISKIYQIYHTVRTVPKYNRTIVEDEAKSIPLRHIYMNTHVCPGLVHALQ